MPDIALEWMAETPDSTWRQLEGTLCFADISGFTALAERLGQFGRAGGEELIETLGSIFTDMLETASRRGGSLLKFGGDALLLLFRGSDHTLQATSAALEMRTLLRRARGTPTSVGPLRLSMSVGLHSGPIDMFLVGRPHRELMLLGPGSDAVIAAEKIAEAGEIVLSPATERNLPRDATKTSRGGARALRWREPRIPACGRVAACDNARELASGLLPASLVDHLGRGVPEPEHRMACIAFARLSGTDELLNRDGPEMLAARLDQAMSDIQTVIEQEGVTLLAVDVDQEGAKLFLASGVPHGHEDEEGVMLRAARRILDSDLPLPIQIGLNRGHVFVAEVGSTSRAAYSAMGDTTNTAARITAKTPPGSIYAHPSVLDESLTRFAVSAAGPLVMKGKAAPQPVYQVGELLGLRQREGLEVRQLIGRKAERQRLLTAVEALYAGRGGRLTLMGGTGVGKTRLLQEAERLAGGATSLSLRAEPYGASRAYRLMRDPLRLLLELPVGDVPDDNTLLLAALRRRAPELLPMAALIGDVLQIAVEPSEEARTIQPQFRPAKTAEAVIQLLETLRPGPQLITVDDAQWTDESSHTLLSSLSKAADTKPWLVIVARRSPKDTGFTPEAAETIDVPPLSDEDMTRFVRVATEAAPLRDHETAAIVGRAGGRPLFAEQILRAAREAGSVDALPESLEAAMAAQVDALDAPAKRVVQYASVLGYSFSTSVLEQLLDKEGLQLDRSLLSRLEDFLIKDEATDRRLRFSSGMICDLVYERIAYRLRARLHLAVGQSMEAQADEPHLVADALTMHFSRSGEWQRTWHYGRIAGARSAEQYANADAARHYEIALEASRQLDSADSETVADTWYALSQVREHAGLYKGALEAIGHALALTREDPLKRAEFLLRRAEAKEREARFAASLADVTAARKALEPLPDSKAKSRLLARLETHSALVFSAKDQNERALQTARKALAIARQVGEKVSEYWALTLIDFAEMEIHGPGDGSNLKQALRIAQEIENLGLEAVARSNLGALLLYSSRWTEAVEMLSAARRLSARIGSQLADAVAATSIGEIVLNQGRIEEAEQTLTSALRTLRSIELQEFAAFAELHLARATIERGAYPEAIEMLRRSEEHFEKLRQARPVLEAMILRSDAVRLSGDAAGALKILEHGATGVEEAGLMQARLALSRGLSLAALIRYEEALEALEIGLGAAREHGQPYEEALLLMARGEVRNRLGANDDNSETLRYQEILKRLGVLAAPRVAMLN